MKRLPRAVAWVLPLWLLAACGTSQSYYRLRADGPAPLASTGPAVGVGPVTLPGYLDRAELVFQSSDYQLQVPAKVRWAGTLGENFTGALAIDLGRRLGSGNMLAYPFPPGRPFGRQVLVDVHQFHAVSGGEAILEAAWRVEEPSSRRVLRQGNVRLTERINGDGYEPVVAAESRLVARLADGIAGSIR